MVGRVIVVVSSTAVVPVTGVVSPSEVFFRKAVEVSGIE